MNERTNIDQIKAELAAVLVRLIDARELTDDAASAFLALARKELTEIRRGDLGRISINQLISLLNKLDHRVDVAINSVVQGNRILNEQPETTSAKHRGLLEIVKDMEGWHAQIPPEELDKLPTDLAANHDHYLYGARKRY
jgi:predicted XRE-type DNA-binding protein